MCFEPMTSPTNALRTGPPGLTLVSPGQAYQAAFEIASNFRPAS